MSAGRKRREAILKKAQSAREPKIVKSDDNLKNYMHGRKNKERQDSVTTRMLLERSMHHERLQYMDECSEVSNIIRIPYKNENIATLRTSSTHQQNTDFSEASDAEGKQVKEHNLDIEQKSADSQPPIVELNVIDKKLEIQKLIEIGFDGRKQRLDSVYKDMKYWSETRKTSTGAGGFATYLGACIRTPW